MPFRVWNCFAYIGLLNLFRIDSRDYLERIEYLFTNRITKQEEFNEMNNAYRILSIIIILLCSTILLPHNAKTAKTDQTEHGKNQRVQIAAVSNDPFRYKQLYL